MTKGTHKGKKKTTKKKTVTKAKKKITKGSSTTHKPVTTTPRAHGSTLSTDIIDSYDFISGDIPIKVTIRTDPEEFVDIYDMQVQSVSGPTEIILEKIRQELIKRVNLGIVELSDVKKNDLIEERFNNLIGILIQKYLPDIDEDTAKFLTSYLKVRSLGLGNLELVMGDHLLEEIVVNDAKQPVWVYHKKHGWVKTNVFLKDENQIRHYASIIGRRVGRQITVLTPLLDAHLEEGDRVNATLSPVSTEGNTITIRKFSRDPWTITKFLQTKTINADAAAIIWSAIQYEMSAIIAGGTASGKTSALNVFASFFPPNQRIISIEDTREIRLPKFLHWVPLNTVLPNAEGKGQISMGHLLVNSLRMRPDRILVGEVRRQQETETLFEAIHTGHSVYATFHANNAQEAIDRLTNPPLEVPKIMLSAISLIVVQFRNRRTGYRRTYQIAEILPSGDMRVLMQYDAHDDTLYPNKNPVKKFFSGKQKSHFYTTIKNFTGLSEKHIIDDHNQKVKILNYLVKHNITSIDGVGLIMAEYYTNKDNLMKYVNADKPFPHTVAQANEPPKAAKAKSKKE